MTDKKNLLNGIKTVILDLDGTMYDKRGLAQRMEKRLWWCSSFLMAERLARRNIHYTRFASEEEYLDAFFMHMSRGHWWSKSIAAFWYNQVYVPAMISLIRRYYSPRPEVMELLQQAKEQGLQLAVYSDYGNAEEKLEALGIDPLIFNLRISAPELGALKPSESCARDVMEMLGAKPETTLFVGDREDKDGASARAVGAQFLLVGDGK